MPTCGCCGEVGKTRTGCSCTGGKSHKCLKTIATETSAAASSSIQPKRIVKGQVRMTKSAWQSLIPGIHVNSDQAEESDDDGFYEVKVIGMSAGICGALLVVYDNDSIGAIKERFIEKFVTAELKPCFDMNNMTAFRWSGHGAVLMNDVLFSSLEKPVEKIWFQSELWDDLCVARRNLARVCSGNVYDLSLDGVLGIKNHINKFMEKLAEKKSSDEKHDQPSVRASVFLFRDSYYFALIPNLTTKIGIRSSVIMRFCSVLLFCVISGLGSARGAVQRVRHDGVINSLYSPRPQ